MQSSTDNNRLLCTLCMLKKAKEKLGIINDELKKLEEKVFQAVEEVTSKQSAVAATHNTPDSIIQPSVNIKADSKPYMLRNTKDKLEKKNDEQKEVEEKADHSVEEVKSKKSADVATHNTPDSTIEPPANIKADSKPYMLRNTKDKLGKKINEQKEVEEKTDQAVEEVKSKKSAVTTTHNLPDSTIQPPANIKADNKPYMLRNIKDKLGKKKDEQKEVEEKADQSVEEVKSKKSADVATHNTPDSTIEPPANIKAYSKPYMLRNTKDKLGKENDEQKKVEEKADQAVEEVKSKKSAVTATHNTPDSTIQPPAIIKADSKSYMLRNTTDRLRKKKFESKEVELKVVHAIDEATSKLAAAAIAPYNKPPRTMQSPVNSKADRKQHLSKKAKDKYGKKKYESKEMELEAVQAVKEAKRKFSATVMTRNNPGSTIQSPAIRKADYKRHVPKKAKDKYGKKNNETKKIELKAVQAIEEATRKLSGAAVAHTPDSSILSQVTRKAGCKQYLSKKAKDKLRKKGNENEEVELKGVQAVEKAPIKQFAAAMTRSTPDSPIQLLVNHKTDCKQYLSKKAKDMLRKKENETKETGLRAVQAVEKVTSKHSSATVTRNQSDSTMPSPAVIDSNCKQDMSKKAKDTLEIEDNEKIEDLKIDQAVQESAEKSVSSKSEDVSPQPKRRRTYNVDDANRDVWWNDPDIAVRFYPKLPPAKDVSNFLGSCQNENETVSEDVHNFPPSGFFL